MALITDKLLGGQYIRTRSDSGRYVVRDDGVVLAVAVDEADDLHSYTEGDIIEIEPSPESSTPSLEERVSDLETAVCELYESTL